MKKIPLDKISKITNFSVEYLKDFEDGYKKGKREAMVEIISRMLDEEIPLEKISKMAKLSMEEIQEIRRKIVWKLYLKKLEQQFCL